MGHIFFSYSGKDRESALRVARQLKEAGHDIWIDVERLRPGDAWLQQIEAAIQQASHFVIYVGRDPIQGYVDLEVRTAIVRSVDDPSFRVIPLMGPHAGEIESLPLFLRQLSCVDIRSSMEQAISAFEAITETASDVPPKVGLDEGQSPFAGLRSFDTKEAPFFFGRDRQSVELVDRLSTNPMLAIVGHSGCGKSSLLRAGLLPTLMRGRMRVGEGTPGVSRAAVIRPGSQPFDSILYALPELNPGMSVSDIASAQPAWRRSLLSGKEGLLDCIAAMTDRGDTILLAIDQFEELFTQTPEKETRLRFIDSLFNAIDAANERQVLVALTLRADHMGRCWEHPELPGRMSHNIYPLSPLGESELTEAIELPLKLAGTKVEPGLTATMIRDLRDSSNAMPLLSHALQRLWEGRQSLGEITHEDYKAIHGLQGAISRHADLVYDRLTEDQKRMTRQIMLALTDVSEGLGFARRRVDTAALGEQAEDSEAMSRLLDLLVERRLLVITTAPGGKRSFVEVTHEALIREWPRYRDWVEGERDNLAFERRIETAADEWEQHQRDQAYLYRGSRLGQAEAWQEQREHGVSNAVREFLAASIAVRDADRDKEEQQRREQLALAQMLAEQERARADEAERANQQIMRLSHLRDLELLKQEADTLWPPFPDTADALRSWLERASSLLDHLPSHEATLEEIRHRATHQSTRTSSPIFARSHDAWWFEAVSGLVADLRAFQDADTGLLQGTCPRRGLGVSHRLAFAETVVDLSLTGAVAEERWTTCLDAIQRSPNYRGLTMEPQIGLLPLGPSPDSGLWEFAHLLSGVPPERDLNGRLAFTESTCIVLVLLPGGTFSMGSQDADPRLSNHDPWSRPDEGPVHSVTLAPFFIGKHQMTQAQWVRLIGQNPSGYPIGHESDGELVKGTHPVEQISWHEANLAMSWLGLTLPTEAQWEYACRAGAQSPWWTGAVFESLAGAANLADQAAARAGHTWSGIEECLTLDDGFVIHAPVDAFRPNAFGLHSMHGNVQEWCLDWRTSYANPVAVGSGLREPDPDDQPVHRIYRGGGFRSKPSFARSAYRSYYKPDFRNFLVGLRAAKPIGSSVVLGHGPGSGSAAAR